MLILAAQARLRMARNDKVERGVEADGMSAPHGTIPILGMKYSQGHPYPYFR